MTRTRAEVLAQPDAVSYELPSWCRRSAWSWVKMHLLCYGLCGLAGWILVLVGLSFGSLAVVGIGTLTFIFLSRFASKYLGERPTLMSVGKDGVRLQWFALNRFIPFAAIAELHADLPERPTQGAVLRVVLRDGRDPLRLAVADDQLREIHAQAFERLESFRDSLDVKRLAEADSQDDSFESLQRRGRPDTHRHLAICRSDLIAALHAPRAPLVERARAVAVLSGQRDEATLKAFEELKRSADDAKLKGLVTAAIEGNGPRAERYWGELKQGDASEPPPAQAQPMWGPRHRRARTRRFSS